MNLQITGNLRSVANSAWVSTMDESKADSKSDDEVLRVTTMLAKEHHTTPFESVTLTFSFLMGTDDEDDSAAYFEMAPFVHSKWVHHTSHASNGGCAAYITTDLFNFVKIAKTGYAGINTGDYHETVFWRLFEAQDPQLASIIDLFTPPPEYDGGVSDVSDQLGLNGITVELVELHDPGFSDHTRATWRVCCPLSIAVQILRHRQISANMSSSRYRTANTDLVDFYDDTREIYRKFIPEGWSGYDDPNDKESGLGYLPNLTFEELLNVGFKSTAIQAYEWVMKEAKSAKNAKKIANDEYKRFREFARYILPEGRMTELYVTFYLPDFLHYLQLRDSHHAQVEHIHVAQLMKKTLNQKKQLVK